MQWFNIRMTKMLSSIKKANIYAKVIYPLHREYLCDGKGLEKLPSYHRFLS